jgi:uncharacterized protein YqeY
MGARDDGAGTGDSPADAVRRRLRDALKTAMRTRDATAVAALRSALAAVDNAEAADPSHAPAPGTEEAAFAGTVAGVGAGDVARRVLSEADVADLIGAEVAERDRTAETYRRAGRDEAADRLRAEADVLRPFLGGPAQPG